MLYQILLTFTRPANLVHQHVYYAILGAILDLLDSDTEIYQALQKLSFTLPQGKCRVQLVIAGSEAYNKALDLLHTSPKDTISLNGNTLHLQDLELSFSYYSPERITPRKFSKFTLTFHSPTFVRQGNVAYQLPEPSQFLFSVWNKFHKLFPEWDLPDHAAFKKWLKYAIYPGSFELKTQLVTIKRNQKSGVVGAISYHIDPQRIEQEPQYLERLYAVLQAVKYLGIGSSVKLGCGNVSCKIG